MRIWQRYFTFLGEGRRWISSAFKWGQLTSEALTLHGWGEDQLIQVWTVFWRQYYSEEFKVLFSSLWYSSYRLKCRRLSGDMSSIPGSGRSPGGENGNPLAILASTIPWTEKPGGLQSMESQKRRTWCSDETPLWENTSHVPDKRNHSIS